MAPPSRGASLLQPAGSSRFITPARLLSGYNKGLTGYKQADGVRFIFSSWRVGGVFILCCQEGAIEHVWCDSLPSAQQKWFSSWTEADVWTQQLFTQWFMTDLRGCFLLCFSGFFCDLQASGKILLFKTPELLLNRAGFSARVLVLDDNGT